MIASLNDTAYAQQELLGEDWEKYEVIPKESTRPQGPLVDGSVPPTLSFLRQKRSPPYWLFYPAGPEAYQAYPNVDPEQVWVSILRRRADKWHRWQHPDRHEFRKRFERYEPDGHVGRSNFSGKLTLLGLEIIPCAFIVSTEYLCLGRTDATPTGGEDSIIYNTAAAAAESAWSPTIPMRTESGEIVGAEEEICTEAGGKAV
jgi:hypothetical protein